MNSAAAELGIPASLWKVYNSQGICSIFDWQRECLSSSGVLSGRNLVFSAPTSAGKTLVAEIVLAKRCIESRNKCIFILPYVSVVREKVHYMRKIFAPLNLRVEGFMGGEAPSGGLSVTDIAVCTIEKANSLINRLIADGSLDVIGLVIVDELHMVGDANRGYLLELLLTKLMFIMKRSPMTHIQIIGMSATLPNLHVIAEWLQASLYKTDFRPVPLQECIKVGNRLIEKGSGHVTEVPIVQLPTDEDSITSLCVETISGGHSVLIFCPTKVRCEKLTITVARGFHHILNSQENEESLNPFIDSISQSRSRHLEILAQLRKCPVGLDVLLKDTLEYGVAYHHAGLTFDERDIIEAGFRTGIVRVLIATSTLSSGVNLPARRVIIRTPVFNGSLLDTLSYSQMSGRAGRKGVDDFGQSILICKPAEQKKGQLLLTSGLKSVKSCLSSMSGTSAALKRAILEIVASGIARTVDDLELYSASTLLMTAKDDENEEEITQQQTLASVEATPGGSRVSPLSACIRYLVDYEFISAEDNGSLFPTQLGVAALSSSLPPEQSLQVFAELQKARRCFCLDNELHLVYLVTPIYCYEVSSNIDWLLFMSLYEKLPSSALRVAELIGVEESFIAKAIRGKIWSTKSGTADQRKLTLHKRFYSSLVLQDLVEETPLGQVARKYSVSRGQLQSLQQSAATFAGMITVFCNRLGWRNLGMLLADFQSRLNFGVQRELVDLVRISVLNAQRARLMFTAGYHTTVQVANASEQHIEQVLKNRQPFQSKNKAENETEFEMKERLAETKGGIWLMGAKVALSEKEAAALIVKEARQLMMDDLRVMGFKLPAQSTSNDVSLLEKSLFANQSNVEQPPAASSPQSVPTADLNDSGLASTQNENVQSQPLNPELVDSPGQEEEIIEETPLLLENQTFSTPTAKQVETSISSVRNASESGSSRRSRKRPSDSPINDFFPPNRSRSSLTDISNQMPGLCNDNIRNSLRLDSSFETPGTDRVVPKRISAILPMNRLLTSQDSPYKSSTPLVQKEVSKVDVKVSALITKGENKQSPLVTNGEGEERDGSNLVLGTQSLEDLMTDSFGLEDLNDLVIEERKSRRRRSNSHSRSRHSNLSDNALMEAAAQKCEIGSDDSLFSMECAQSCVAQSPHFSKSNESLLLFGDDSKEDQQENQLLAISSVIKSINGEETDDERKENSNSILFDSLHSSFCEEPNDFEKSSAKLFSLIDVTTSLGAFESFAEEAISQSCYSFAFALKRVEDAAGIDEMFSIPELDAFVAGISFTWSGYQSHYLALTCASEVNQDDSLVLQLPETQYSSVSSALILDFLCRLFQRPGVTRVAANAKNQMRILMQTLDIRITEPVWDPCIANWVLNPSADDSITQIAINSVPDVDFSDIFPQVCWNAFTESKTGKVALASSGRQRASVESVMVLHCQNNRSLMLKRQSLFSYFTEVESKIQLINCELELNGFGVSEKVFSEVTEHCAARLSRLEAEACSLVGRKFDLSSSEDVGFVLYFELKLPPNGDPENLKPSSNFQKCLGLNCSKMKYKRRGQAIRLPKEYSTSKETLKRLESFHPLAAIITEYRKIDFVLKKVMMPLEPRFIKRDHCCLTRIYSHCDTYSATGRMSFNEPNLQNIPKQFPLIPLGAAVRRTRRSAVQTQPPESITPRCVFTTDDTHILLAADFSQIELRLLAHFSQDDILLGFLNSGGDVFKSIASNWRGVPVEEVSDADRQRAKGLCYGIVYGMGAKTLSEQLESTVEEAEAYIESFRQAFPAVFEFVARTKSDCRESGGSVRTLLGRERRLENINHDNGHLKSHAERQAVNSVIQGSASEVLKCGLVAVRDELRSAGFSTNHLHSPCGRVPGGSKDCFLVLHVHDEVIYEVSRHWLAQAAAIVQSGLEGAVADRGVSVRLPVKLKCGRSWGTMVDYDHFMSS